MNFGCPIPTSVKDVYYLDKLNNYKLWFDSICKELDKLILYDSFKVLPWGEKEPPGYSYVPVNMVFDVKFDGQLKTCNVIGGNRTRQMEADKVYGLVLRLDFIWVLFLLAVMNDLDLRMVDVNCFFLQSKCKVKFTIDGIKMTRNGWLNIGAVE